MKSAIAAAALASLSLVSGAPLAKRQAASGVNDGVILNYALTLEHLEATFYAQGLANFSESAFSAAGFDSTVRERITEIGGHEQQHVAFLTTALQAANVTPTAACTYDFGVTSVKSFLATASILEGVGVSAYLGAAASIVNKAYLTAAGSILTVEARHSAYVRGVNGEDPIANAFDTPLDFDEVYSLAAGFITSCPSSNPTLPVKAFPALTATPVGTAKPSGMVKLTPAKTATVSGKGQIYAVFVGLTGNQYGLWNPSTMTVEIPYNAAGQTYVVLQAGNGTVSDDSILAGPAVLEVATSYGA